MSQELIAGLNNSRNREISTALRYMLQAAAIRGGQWQPVRDMYLSEVQDEMGHAQYLANKIAMLDGTAELKPDLTPPPTDPRQMLQNDIEQERVDVTGYLKLARMAEQSGYAELKMRMEEMAADEDSHAEAMQRLL